LSRGDEGRYERRGRQGASVSRRRMVHLLCFGPI
jgi:hypothetical protein